MSGTASSVVPVLAAVVLAGTGLLAVRASTAPTLLERTSASASPSAAARPPASGIDARARSAAVPSPDGVGTDGAARRSQGQVGGAVPRGRWQWPLSPRPAVARPFVPPRSTWGAGHRGVDLAGAAGRAVRAVADGTVTHVGLVAGRPTLTITHADGLRSTYEPVRAGVQLGQRVTAGQVVGTVALDGSHCSPQACLHLGALRGREYLDPMTLLGPVRVRLLPLWRSGS